MKDTYLDIQTAAQKAANAVGGINNQTFGDVKKRLSELNSQLDKIAKTRNVSFNVQKVNLVVFFVKDRAMVVVWPPLSFIATIAS